MTVSGHVMQERADNAVMSALTMVLQAGGNLSACLSLLYHYTD
jgi:hypothetical protein